jgi:hypothetical protein
MITGVSAKIRSLRHHSFGFPRRTTDAENCGCYHQRDDKLAHWFFSLVFDEPSYPLSRETIVKFKSGHQELNPCSAGRDYL